MGRIPVKRDDNRDFGFVSRDCVYCAAEMNAADPLGREARDVHARAPKTLSRGALGSVRKMKRQRDKARTLGQRQL
jgi:hypothetical protein